MPRCLPILTPFLDRFFIDLYVQLRSPEPSNSLFFLRKNKVFSKNRFSKLASISVRFWCQQASILPPKIHQNPSKNRFQDASFFRSIFASILLRFWRPTWSHVGHFFLQNTARLNAPRMFFFGSIFFFGFWSVLAPSWRPLGRARFGRVRASILEVFGAHFLHNFQVFCTHFFKHLSPMLKHLLH